jgi:hypothetical protein
MKIVGRQELMDYYLKYQDSTQKELDQRLDDLISKYSPTHFVLYQCEVLDSSSLGACFIIPLGPNNTHNYPSMPNMLSPRGLASDISCPQMAYVV